MEVSTILAFSRSSRAGQEGGRAAEAGQEAHLCYLSRLVIASQQRHVGWVLGFQEQQQCEHFQAVVSPVYKVPQEDVARVRYLPAGVEELQHVVELTVYVAAYLQARQAVRDGSRRARSAGGAQNSSARTIASYCSTTYRRLMTLTYGL